MSKRRMKILLSLVIVLVVLVGGYFIANQFGLFDEKVDENNNLNENNNNQEEQVDRSLFDFNDSEIETVVLKKQDEEIKFIKVKSIETDDEGSEKEVATWTIENIDKSLNESKIRSLESTIKYLTYETYIGKKSDLGEFGLDEPVAKISIETYDDMDYELHIGDTVPGDSGYYAMNTDNKEVVIISNYRSEKILLSLTDLIDTSLIEYTPEDVIGFSIDRKGEDKIVAVNKTKKELESLADKFETMKIVKPIKWDANRGNILTAIEPFLNLQAQEYVELEADDLSEYGLDDPDYIVTVSFSDDNDFVLNIGNRTDDGKGRYAKEEESKDVIIVSDSNLGFIDIPLKDLMSSFVAIINIKDVEEIYFKADGYELDCELEIAPDDSDEEDMFYINGMDATAKNEKDTEYFRKFYQALLSAFVYDFDFDAKPDGEPEIVIEFKLTNGEKKLVEYIKRDDYTYYALVNNEYAGALVRASDFYEEDGVYKILPDLLENLKEIEE